MKFKTGLSTFEAVLVAVVALLLIVGINALLFGIGVLVLTWAWNTLLADVLQLPTISFIQGVALAVLLGFTRTAVTLVLNRDQK